MTKRTEEDVLEDFFTRSLAILGKPHTEAADGRVAIRLRNREKIIGAFIELVVEGKAATIDEIVERAGVGRRSIFRHFTDLSELTLAAMRTVIAEAAPHAILEDPGFGPLAERVESFVEARLQTLARMYPFRSGANPRLVEMDVVKAGISATIEMMRVQISGHFANELSAIDPAEVENVVDSIYVATSYESYAISVGQLGRSVESVRTTWLRSLHRLLTP